MYELSKTIRFGGKTHETLERAISSRLRVSQDDMSKYHDLMASAEEQFVAYIKESDNDKLRKDIRNNSGLPQYTTIEIPYSYATLLTAHTYFTSVFLSRSPVMQYTARHGEVMESEQAVEALIDYQINVGNNLVPLYMWLLDPGKYSFGVVGSFWDEETIISRQIVEEQETFLGIPIPGRTKKVNRAIKMRGYVGNRLFNVRPQDFFPDTRVPLHQFQRGEFCGRYVEIPWYDIEAGEKAGKYFNVDVLKMNPADRTQRFRGHPARVLGSENAGTLPGEGSASAGYFETEEKKPSAFVKAHEFCWRIVPSAWGLGPGEDYEIWVFTRATDGVIFQARPLGCYHGKFPYDVLQYEPDGYNLMSRSMLQTIKPMNDTLTWLINTHFYNVRASLNNMFLYDPSMVMQKDIENPNPGKLLRLKPAAYGRDVRTLLAQFQVSDVTSNHIQDSQVIADMIQRVTGVTDNIMGMVNAGGRKTATEVRTSTTFGTNRLKTVCEYFSAMGFGPLAQKMLQNSQQHYDMDRQFRIVGDLSMMDRQFTQVTPESIAGFYDFIPVDGTLPVDRFAQANLWQGLLGQLRNYPQIMMTYDFARIFSYIAQLAGLKNISQFKVKVVPDETMMQAAQAGNVVPMKPSGVPERMPQVQTPNMGQAV